MHSSEYQVTGMTCGHCERSILEEVGEIQGVEVIEVSAKAGKLVVGGAEEVDEAQVLAAVAAAGYAAVRVA
ncbi:heavy metal transporter [Mycobacteroides abscessus]|uniref:heavy-metal-associated domain-containing protein n=1 Tax=Mycobacteroides abscessus TaxID=36809 RepID=UPI0005E714AA|nr:cation transporter [Mycobacteroides abscessus]AMU57865.1 heavy metal transporter [Mycobacteroides abscessus]MBE5435137.1 hypothetical protein [Mycobacteroides abscessus]MBE5486236.1 hypothetical protein [Mycobacteroides abscessus]MBN7445020.1 cation transporter [Mycobacteroides abscessus subsp. abscessus]MBN7449210.1 cation transporter [Mycobacteroides abscessus subsp. abscessus]